MMLCGENIAGGFPIYGELRNLNVVPVAFGEYLLTFDVKNAHPDGEWVWLVLLDAKLLKVLPATARSTSIQIPDNLIHSLQVVPVDQYMIQGSYPRIVGDTEGYRAYIVWPKSTDATVRSYRVYGDGGTGTIDEETALEILADLDTESLVEAVGSSGTGTITVWGQTALTEFNGVLTIEITSTTPGSSAFRYRYNTGSWEARDFESGEVALIDGISVRFDSALSAYAVGASWDVAIGPRSFFVSEPLEQGEYQFLIKAADEAGNETSLDGGAITVYMDPPGDPITGKSAVYDLVADEITVAWTNPADANYTGAHVFTNYDIITGELTPYIIEEQPGYKLPTPGESLTIESPVDGTWLFRVKPVYSDKGTPSDIELLIVEVGTKSTNVDLSDPYNLIAVLGAGGQVTLTWEYNLGTGGDLDEFHLFLYDDLGELWTTGAQGGIEPVETYNDGVIVRYSYDLGTLVGTQYAAVVAFNSPHSSPGRDYVTIEPDATGPTFSGESLGCAV